MMPLTRRQGEVLQFIRRYWAEEGLSPTQKEIAAHLGVGKVTVYELVNRLERKGAIKRERCFPRSIQVLAAHGNGRQGASVCPHCGAEVTP
jgi:SOS-response transcriptional repressor LexA